MNYTLCRLMSPDLPLSLDPERLAKRGETLCGHYKIQDMSRLEGLLYDTGGRVNFKLNFTHNDDTNQSYIIGEISADINIICQRCLGSMSFPVNSEINLGIVTDESRINYLPDNCEPIITNNEPVSLQVLIEDELILAIPVTAMHPDEKCEATKKISELKDNSKTRPFADLKQLIRNSKST